MERFPLPSEVMRIIFEKSRQLTRAEGRKRMEARISNFCEKLRRSETCWINEYVNADLEECDLSEAAIIVRKTLIPVEYTEPWRTLWIRFQEWDPTNWSGAYTGADVYTDDEDDEEEEEEEEEDPMFLPM
jgi:hypothetical protein